MSTVELAKDEFDRASAYRQRLVGNPRAEWESGNVKLRRSLDMNFVGDFLNYEKVSRMYSPANVTVHHKALRKKTRQLGSLNERVCMGRFCTCVYGFDRIGLLTETPYADVFGLKA